MLDAMSRRFIDEETVCMEMKRDTWPSDQGSAWMTVVISGKVFFFIMC